MEEALKKERVEVLLDYIMKKCLWEFHSRAWDRERQNREILGWAKKSLLGEADEAPTDRLDRCHWVDGVVLARAWKKRCRWLSELDAVDTSELVDAVHERLDVLTITGSLNKELTDHQY
jgi:nitrogenase delta subunit